jgi:hypothetical protein
MRPWVLICLPGAAFTQIHLFSMVFDGFGTFWEPNHAHLLPMMCIWCSVASHAPYCRQFAYIHIYSPIFVHGPYCAPYGLHLLPRIKIASLWFNLFSNFSMFFLSRFLHVVLFPKCALTVFVSFLLRFSPLLIFPGRLCYRHLFGPCGQFLGFLVVLGAYFHIVDPGITARSCLCLFHCCFYMDMILLPTTVGVLYPIVVESKFDIFRHIDRGADDVAY